MHHLNYFLKIKILKKIFYTVDECELDETGGGIRTPNIKWFKNAHEESHVGEFM